MSKDLQVQPSQALAPPAPRVPTVPEMLYAVLQKDVTVENVAAVESLTKLYERMEDRDAEKAFARAFVSLQAEMPKVKATKVIPSNDGSVRSRFAPYEEIMEQVGPLLLKHGFTVSFTTKYDGPRIVKSCWLQHVDGHKREYPFAARIGSGPPKASEAQADGAASTFAKRYALCEALNIVVDLDTDARAEGGTITADQAFELERRVAESNSDKAKFLKFAGAATYSEIAESKYAILDEFLRRKEQGQP